MANMQPQYGMQMPAYGQMYYPTNMQPMQMIPPQPVQPTQFTGKNQNGDFMPVQSEEEAKNYPVGYGNSVRFKDENKPYIYEKIMGLSQFEKPIFKKYRLVEEESSESTTAEEAPKIDILENTEKYDELKNDIKDLRAQLNNVRNRLNSLSPKEKGGDTK